MTSPSPRPSRPHADVPPGSVQAALKQTRPFRSASAEALVALLLTAETVRWPLQDMLAAGPDLTLQQYNVLRILRGAGKAGLPTLEIGARMIERTPGITRLLDRLEQKGLIVRERSQEDRRQVIARITDAGADLVRSLDRPLQAVERQVFGDLSDADLRELIRVLDRVRSARPQR